MPLRCLALRPVPEPLQDAASHAMRAAARGRVACYRPAEAGAASLRAGITLLELLLALALTGVVMMIITMAIQLHLRTLDSRRADVEQSQVARAVLQHIAADIRNAVWYEPLDVSGIEELAAGGTSSAAQGSEPGGQAEEETGPEEDRSSASQASGGRPVECRPVECRPVRAGGRHEFAGRPARFRIGRRAVGVGLGYFHLVGARQRARLVWQSIRIADRL